MKEQKKILRINIKISIFVKLNKINFSKKNNNQIASNNKINIQLINEHMNELYLLDLFEVL